MSQSRPLGLEHGMNYSYRAASSAARPLLTMAAKSRMAASALLG